MPRGPSSEQLNLFGAPAPKPSGVGAAEASSETTELAQRLPAAVYLGGSTWSFPGWGGTVYDRDYPQARLAREGLAAYAHYPLFKAVGIDRTHYAPVAASELLAYAAAVPEDFLFLVKAHEACTLVRFPDHARYGTQRGQDNPLFLDSAYAADRVVGPTVEGLGAKGGALLFQFAPQSLGTPAAFAGKLHRFLAALPRGPVYAVEVRNRELITPAYGDALAAVGACHCHNVYPRMPDLRAQARLAGSARNPLTVVRWLVAPTMTYEESARRFAPFSRIVEPDPASRQAVATLAKETLASGRRFLATVNNNAEGSAPLSVIGLAREILA